MCEEDHLVTEALAGDDNAFARLLSPYRDGMLNLAYRITGDRDDAHEVCQESIIKIHRYLRSFKSGRSFRSWIYKIVLTSAYDFIRKHGRSNYSILQNARQDIRENRNPEQSLLDGEFQEKIAECINHLSTRERIVFYLREGEGLSVKQTCKLLKCSSMSVRTHLSRARSKIRNRLKNIYFY
jgi:RNA polymerase sigma-70 factor (ECF subfamily)